MIQTKIVKALEQHWQWQTPEACTLLRTKGRHEYRDHSDDDCAFWTGVSLMREGQKAIIVSCVMDSQQSLQFYGSFFLIYALEVF